MKIRHLIYSIVLGITFGFTLGVLVYTVPVNAQTPALKLPSDLTEVRCHHEAEAPDCGCDLCEKPSDCETCSKCSDGDSQDSDSEESSKETEESYTCGEEATTACSIEGN